MTQQILILNGPNLNLLGTREPEVYGTQSLDDIESALREQVAGQSIELDFFQTNAEHELIDRIHSARGHFKWAIINPGAFTHTSIALRDAFLATEINFVEVHLSNVHQRESFRQHSYLSDIAAGVITGLGAQGYRFALEFIVAQSP
ncbi:MAG: type II 3-dehydroquinate dehydratase [Pseudomonadales bacterium]|jgi:3-dehydroquinate dehydratase-2|nr:type II 3-dehydroquinate dehydratase [Pseudomonadales bacterium]MDA0956667.1 type II 3-dehydroquinate dehydratase [Pseudomonadota bacterium]